MTLTGRLARILGAVFYAACAVLMLYMGESGFLLVMLVIGVTLTLFGIRTLYYYFTMARYMVGGRGILYVGVLGLDFGIFTLSVSQHYGFFVVLYLMGVYAFAGVMDILRALEARRLEAPSWRFNLAEGGLNIAFAIAVVAALACGNLRELSVICAAGFFNTAAAKLISACRKTAIVYIP